MRQSFHLVRGVDSEETFRTLPLLAARIHELRGDRSVHLRPCNLGRVDGVAGVGVSVRFGDDQQDLGGYAFFPETPAYEGGRARQLLTETLHALRPDLERRRPQGGEDFDEEAA